MSEPYTYKIQGYSVYQTELTIGQDIELMKLFRGLRGELTEEGAEGLITQILEAGKLEEVLRVVLRGDINKVKIQDITNSELEAIVTDFFDLNGSFVRKLGDWLGEAMNLMNQLPIPEKIVEATS